MKRLLMSLTILAAVVIPVAAQAATVELPIEGYYERQTIKQFGTFVDQAFLNNHPNEFRDNGYPKFTGYHAAADIDYTGAGEDTREVPVKAVADGEVIYKAMVEGYGGVIVIRHTNPESVTALYGHVRVADAPVNVGDQVTAGQTIAYLGAPFGEQTGGERKHLHFGVHKGATLDLNGHEVSSQTLAAEWYNPNDWLARYVPKTDPGLTAASETPTAAATPEPAKSKTWFDQVVDFFKNLFS